MDDDIPLIPCEFCNEAIRAHEYYHHANLCSIRQSLPSSITVRDEEDHTVYRIHMGNAMEALERLLVEIRMQGDNLEQDPMHPIESVDILDPQEPAPFLETQPEAESLFLMPGLPPIQFTTIGNLLSENLGKVYVGLDDPESVLSPDDELTLPTMCPICQDDIDQDVAVKTICNHTYCKPCILKWLSSHKKCPVCMIDLEDLQKEKLTPDIPST